MKNNSNSYEGFVDKFKPKKTTDDCYTPPGVYDAVCNWAVKQFGLEGREVVRPFYPGGDYERYTYPNGCVVIDNPPFSIYAKIVRFYLSRGIEFLLFAPALTQLVNGAEVCYLCTFNDVTYMNGALVRTSFTTNMVHGIRLWTAPDLRELVQKEADKFKRENRMALYGIKNHGVSKKCNYPDHLITSATVGKISSRGVELKIKSNDCCYISSVGEYKIFGYGLLLSERSAAERAAAERAAAERAGNGGGIIQLEIDPYKPDN